MKDVNINIPKTPKISPCSSTEYDVMTVSCAKQLAAKADIKELAAHIADISTRLDRMNYNAGTGWEDQAVIAMMAVTRMAVWKAAGHPPIAKADPVPASNDNEPPVDMKMAA